jgi:hypothetical protein
VKVDWDSDVVQLDYVVKFYQLLAGGLKDAGSQCEQISNNQKFNLAHT